MLARAYWLELGFAIKPENVYEIGMFLQFIIYNQFVMLVYCWKNKINKK